MNRPPRTVSARARILGAVLAVACAGLVVVGGITFWVQQDTVLRTADGQLRTFAASVATEPMPDRAAVIDVVHSIVPDRTDGTIAVADGEVIAAAPSATGLHLADDEEFVRALSASSPTAAEYGTVNGDHGTLRYVALPVDGAVIAHAVLLDARMQLVITGVLTYTVTGLGMLLAIGVVGWFVIGRLLLPLRDLRATADAVTIGDFGARLPADGNDEISDLTRTVNSMLDRIEVSVDVQRQLLDDVRHELKTPITIVRGHLETMDVTDPVDVATTREIGMSELDRMTRLVDDIDLLAAVEDGALTMNMIDVDALTARVGELVAVIPGHSWSVESRGYGRVEGDYDRLLQAWLQLADNAAKYTPEGTPVEIGSSVDDAGAHLWVRDHGPGIPPASRHRIFRRFDRAEGRRTVGGSGLGLAIVDAIVKGHDGHCSVTETPGGGATFTIHIPPGRGRAPADLPAPVRAGDVVQQREASG
ncbi:MULTISPECIES: sensor histidine kinase [Microbacterium]|uniref:histidine kinase n=1 Tax=Microbacterium wangchenii TaxID=2541726 RepID=A0ABX5ST41_9MICO|nr:MULTISPECIES: HAMP domain-containing sensor histidine kinase [Microbacterium]MCK6067758.1 HAMP domain-containing histidine kinase [Microbacterium sp. EYE_512]QBR89333.1 HAMP domain-containing histidine kinase [Microbacterium wangchenii]TXK11006.1 HAMP domain-containing histidine kinase [Microbacterium wangchenii]